MKPKELNYGTFEGHPAVWNGENFGLVDYGEGWREIPVAEVYGAARVMPKAEFDATFPDVRPLPRGAFKT
jgi:hypothetical protein